MSGSYCPYILEFATFYYKKKNRIYRAEKFTILI